jgi:hypothetical protein
MGDKPKYTLGQARAGKVPMPKWEDFDEQTRAKITQYLAHVHEQLIESLQPVIESASIAVLPMMQQISDFMPQVTALAEKAGQMADFIRRWVPKWSGDVDPDKAWAITAEGIPLAFVPRPQLVDELIAATDRDARLEFVLRSKKLILSDCRAALQPDEDDPLPDSISMLPPLLLEVIDVLKAGYIASACALGASVIDSALRRTSKKKLVYKKVRATAIATELQKAVAENDFRVSLAMRPLHSLLEEWYPSMETPVPSMPSRHVVAHWADPEHLSETNAIIITMAATSLLLGLAEREVVAERVAAESA